MNYSFSVIIKETPAKFIINIVDRHIELVFKNSRIRDSQPNIVFNQKKIIYNWLGQDFYIHTEDITQIKNLYSFYF
tara:strand:- start:523 stop:750 length:228 start_codon:yes stop_codon:yes gene_type:complete